MVFIITAFLGAVLIGNLTFFVIGVKETRRKMLFRRLYKYTEKEKKQSKENLNLLELKEMKCMHMVWNYA